MVTRYMQDLAKLCHVQDSELGIEGHFEIPAQKKIVENFVLKNQILSGDEFLVFMTEWGTESIRRDAETGKLLMELALQRVSKVVPHEAYYLPSSYRQCTASGSETAMTKPCWDFFRKNVRYCLEALDSPVQRHAELILLGLLKLLNEDGSTNEGFRWDEAEIGISAQRAYTDLLRLANITIPFYRIVEALAPYWRKKRLYFKSMEDVVDWSSPDIYKAFAHDAAVDKQGNPYFSRRTKIFLKIFGLYQFTLILMIRQDMRTLT